MSGGHLGAGEDGSSLIGTGLLICEQSSGGGTKKKKGIQTKRISTWDSLSHLL